MNALKAARSHFRNFQERTREPGLTALLMIEVSLIFIAMPLAGMGAIPELVVPIMFVLLVIAILVVTSRSHFAAALVVIAVVLSPFGAFVRAEHPSLFTDCFSAAGRLLALGALSWVIARAVFGAGRVTVHRVQGAVLLYLNFALFFFVIYRLIETLIPNCFSGLPQAGAEHGSGAALLYFSFSTLTTAGFGDITPLNPLARQPRQSGIGDRAALSGNTVGAAGQSRARASAASEVRPRRLRQGTTSGRCRPRARRGRSPCRAPIRRRAPRSLRAAAALRPDSLRAS